MKQINGLGTNATSQASLASSIYQVPVLDGRLMQATPLKFCLKYRPPTIAVVYSFMKSSTSSRSKSSKPRRYIHEIRVDFDRCREIDSSATRLALGKPTLGQVEKLCEQLCE